MVQLFTPIKLRDVTVRNRIFVSPMCQYSCSEGIVTDWHLVHLGSRAVGGAGLVMVEASAVSPEGRISPMDAGIWSTSHALAFAPIVRFIEAQGAVAAIQLAHAGRKASTDAPWNGGKPLSADRGGWQPVGASALAFDNGHPEPRVLKEIELDGIVEQFVAAARRARDAGFRVVEIHMAHGYLLHSFLSPLSNTRQDSYGGAFEGRTKLPLRVVEAVRSAWPSNLPLLVRLSATDWVEGGWDVEQSIRLARLLSERGVDLVDCSSGGMVPTAKVPAGPGFQVPFAQAMRQQARIATGAVGLITSAAQAEQVLVAQMADVVLLGRELLRDPYWPLHAAKQLGADVPWPRQYLRAKA